MNKLINELIIGVRGIKGFMEDGSPKDNRAWISLGIKFHDREWEII